MDEPAQRVFRSPIWEFFERGASDATCRTCKMRLKTPTGTTTTLVNHLKRHPDPFKQFEKLRAAECSKKASGPKKTTATKTADASAASCSYFKPTLKGDSQRAKMLTTKVAQFMAAGLHSYSIVEEPGFLSLMHAAVPEYKVPLRTTFSRSVIPDLYAKEKERIKGALRHHFDHGTSCYSVTTDGWSSRPGDSYVSFTCHLLDEEFTLHNYHLACRHMPEGHTSENLKNRGVSACLTYLDFFSMSAQRAALTVAANCCQSLTADEFPLVGDSVALLSGRLSHGDRKSVESACLALARLVDCLAAHGPLLQEVAAQGLLPAAQGLLALSPPPVSSATFVMVVRMLAVLCAACPHLAVQLLNNNIAETLRFLLMGNSDPLGDDIELVPRSPQELYEITSLIAELMPVLPQDGIFVVDSLLVKPNAHQTDAVLWKWRDDRGLWHPYSSIDCKIIEASAAHQSGEDEISLSTMGKTYTLDFNLMQQINEDTGTARPVQRVTNQGMAQMLSGGASATATGASLSSPSSSSSSPSQSGGGATAVAADPRAMWLREQSHAGGRAFLGALFGALHEVYSSSAGPAVRHRCLRALLRMVHCAPAPLLAEVC
ncbi:hypothetical protein HPB52_009577 [Rhipicephalus sanguineus]|uniref:E3 ubiquitin-protein ligase n=1 Tax=Rhipicephalus sanguineus TaxID=34632 RepID=A0A9D4SYQ2_RHISA|nr:hypothetical protein HPB52_009577 [Rhipicephalus sanguineus]